MQEFRISKPSRDKCLVSTGLEHSKKISITKNVLICFAEKKYLHHFCSAEKKSKVVLDPTFSFVHFKKRSRFSVLNFPSKQQLQLRLKFEEKRKKHETAFRLFFAPKLFFFSLVQIQDQFNERKLN